MEWSTFSDFASAFIASFLLFLSFILIPEIRQKRKYWISILILLVLSLLLGIDRIKRDGNEKQQQAYERRVNAEKIDSLTAAVGNLTTESHLNNAFLASLKSQFNIIKDENNHPRKVEYNTTIENAETVNIGSPSN